MEHPCVQDPLVVRVSEYAVSYGVSHLMVDLDYDLLESDAYIFSESYTSIFECDLETLSYGVSISMIGFSRLVFGF